MFKSCVVIGAAALLAACGAPAPKGEAAHRAAPPAAGAGIDAGATAKIPQMPSGLLQAPAGADVYAIDPSQSEVRLLVYRAGPMASLGHNHVILHRAVGGWIRYTGDPATVSFALDLPVAGFSVDDPGARAQEGTDFFEEVTDEAKQGTRHNMLSPALLDGERFPSITLTSVAVTEAAGAMSATMSLQLAGHESTLKVPFQAATGKGQISVSGIVKLRQTALGLKPFSTMMGALQVQDEMTVKFILVAALSPGQ